MSLNVLGLVRNLALPSYGDGDEKKLGMNNLGQLAVAQGLPPKADLVKMGETYSACIPTGSAFTHVAAWPTTRAELVLKNNEPAGGKSYVLDSAWAANVATSMAAASAYTLLGQLVDSHATAVTDDTAVLRWSRSGKKTYPGKAHLAVANTTYGIANKWEVLGGAPAGPAASIGLAVFAELGGGWIVPPGGIMLFNLVVGTATGTASIGITWHEVKLPVNA